MPVFTTEDSLDITAASHASVDGVNTFSNALLAFKDEAGVILQVADSDPDCPLAQAYAAMFHASADTNEGFSAARGYLAQAKATASSATPREQAIIAAAKAACGRDLAKAAAIFEQVLEENPSDILSAKWAQGMHFECGNAPGILRAPLKVATQCDGNAHLHSMLAFGYEECHLLDQAEQSVHRALKLDRTAAWAHHAMAHICEGRNRLSEGLDFLDEYADTWVGLMPFMSTHNWWHRCLFLIDLNRGDEVWDVFHGQVWARDKAQAQVQINAISLLYRLERTGLAVKPEIWADIAAHVQPNAESQASVFLDLQYIYVLARADMPAAKAMLARIEAKAARVKTAGEVPWNKVAVIAAPAIVALANHDYGKAADLFALSRASMSAIGGSHAQRDLMTLFYLDALRGAGRWEKVQQLLVGRNLARPKTSWITTQLAEAYVKLGLGNAVRI